MPEKKIKEEYPSTRTEALSLGEKLYYTGKPCKHGHYSPRRTHNGNCLDCQDDPQAREWRRQYLSRWFSLNKDKERLVKRRTNRYGTLADRAYGRVYRAVRKGLLLDLKEWVVACVDCAVERATQYDHRDYSFPLLVDPVCRGCNKRRGAGIKGESNE